MIDIRELRIGNLIIPDGFSIPRVICAISMDYEDEHMEYVDHVSIGAVSGVISHFCQNVNSIPLTEEWLRKFGFDQSGLYWFQGHLYIYEKGIHNVVYYYKVNYDEMEIKYVHQLQNLCFALTGQELMLKEPI